MNTSEVDCVSVKYKMGVEWDVIRKKPFRISCMHLFPEMKSKWPGHVFFICLLNAPDTLLLWSPKSKNKSVRENEGWTKIKEQLKAREKSTLINMTVKNKYIQN